MEREYRTGVLIVGGGVGGCACALALANHRIPTILTEPTDWLGGQLTTQAVPPDEHRWIEEKGCTRRYRAYREAVRDFYRRYYSLTETARANPYLNPGGGWVSRLCHEPKVGVAVLDAMLAYPQMAGWLTILYHHQPIDALTEGDFVRAVRFRNTQTGETCVVYADYIVDASELGDLLPLAGVEYRTGAESQAQTGEPHAKQEPEPHNMQAFTWCMAVSFEPEGEYVIEKPSQYERWRAYQPPFWHAPFLGWVDVNPITREPRQLDLWGDEGVALFPYRQIVAPTLYPAHLAPSPVTIVNWPQNDYFEGSIIDVPESEAEQYLESARQLSLSLLYWLQTEAPRPDGGVGYPNLRLRPDITGSADGLAKAPYIREARRICARFTMCEQHISVECRPGATLAEPFPDSVGIGHYRIDLHPTTGGDNYLDIDALPFQIPLGALLPVRVRNLLPACKNIGTTHLTNGCYRLHPVEWNIGESVGVLIAFCQQSGVESHQVYEIPHLLADYQAQLTAEGVPLAWEF